MGMMIWGQGFGYLWPAGLEGAWGRSPAGGGGGRDDGGAEAVRAPPEPGSRGSWWVVEAAGASRLNGLVPGGGGDG